MSPLEIQRLIMSERQKQNIPYRRFAEMIGCSPGRLVDWKNEKTHMSLDYADKALKVLGISVMIGKEEQRNG